MTVRRGVFRRSRQIVTLLVGVFVCTAAAVAVARSAGATVTTHQGKLGMMLAGRNGHTLYLFMHDSRAMSSCYGSCARIWAPDLTRGRPIAAAGSRLNAKLLGTTRRTNGALQVTYNGHPLYFYSGDSKPGTLHGENRKQFGGWWYAVSTKGRALKPRLQPGGFNPGSY